MPTALIDLSVLSTAARARGIGRYVAELALGLAEVSRGTRLRVLGLERLGVLGTSRVTEDLAGAVQRLCAADAPLRSHTQWASSIRFGLAPTTHAVAPDLVHTGHPGATPLRQLSCARVTTCHDLIPLNHPRHHVSYRSGFRAGRQRLDSRRFRAADHVIAVSQTSAGDLVRLLGVSGQKITVVYNGVDSECFGSEPRADDRRVRAQQGLDEVDYVLCVGGASWRKNPEHAIAALARARAAQPEGNLVLAWAGELSVAERGMLRALAAARGVSAALRLVGYVDDRSLAALYRGAVALLFPSRAEGFGYPIIEAMAAGCPVITANRAATAEIAGDAARLVDPEDAEAMAHAVLALGQDGAERARLGRAGVARAASYSRRRMANETLSVYERVLGA